MGGAVSAQSKPSENVLLRKFAGLEPITDNDPFWNQLLSFNMKIDQNDRNALKDFELSINDPLEALMYNTQTTGNFAAFIRVFLRRSAELKMSALCNDKIFLWQTGNALMILRFICKFLTQRLSDSEFAKVFTKNILTPDGKMEACPDFEEPFENTAEELLNSLVEILVDLAVNESTMPVHIEAVKCLLSVLSSQLYHETAQGASQFYGYLMSGRCSIHSPLLTKALLHNYLEHNTPYKTTSSENSGSIVFGLAATMWSVMQLATGSETEEVAEDKSAPVTLGSVSILLLLNLACHQPDDNRRNPYRETLAAFHNAQEVSSLTTSASVVATFKLDYGALYDRLCATVTQEPPMLLLYLLLHRNGGFRNYVLSRVNLENLVLPVLKVLHGGQNEKQSSTATTTTTNSHHVYLALIVVLILSEDDFFCKIVHETMLKNVDWYQGDRPLGEISLGGLLVLVLVRTIQFNTIKTRDRYLHTNCLAALANMSVYFKQLSAAVCQKLVGLLEVLTKRHLKLVDHIRMSAEYDLSQAQGQNQSFQQDITALEEGIRTILEIINSCLTNGLRYNPHLIYTILYKRELFDAFQNHPMFQDLIWNVSAVINHFATRVQSLEKGSSVSQVLDVIQKGALQWPTDRLKKFPELKFKYVEDENTVEFFVPYVWRLVFKHAGLYWDPTRVKLFSAMIVFQTA